MLVRIMVTDLETQKTVLEVEADTAMKAKKLLYEILHYKEMKLLLGIPVRFKAEDMTITVPRGEDYVMADTDGAIRAAIHTDDT